MNNPTGQESPIAATKLHQIKSLGGEVLLEAQIPADTPSGLATRVALEKATAARAYLGGADLRGAYLGGADLGGAYLGGAYLRGADLRGAYLRGADLRGADLGGAYLGGAYLRGADLGGADLGGKKLVGDRPVLQIGPIGSRDDYLLAFLTDQGVVIEAGCFEGSIEEFLEQLQQTHGTNEHAREYGAALALIHVHAQLWTPAPDASEPAKAEQEAA